LTGKPTLGSLAALSSLAYDSVTGKPTLGPFAGLAKLLSTNVSTYIESGAIGSAQIDQAYIGTLFGKDASFSGTVYAENIDGDVTDLKVKATTSKTTTGTTAQVVLSFSVSSLPFARNIVVSGIHAKFDGNFASKSTEKVGGTFRLKYGTTTVDSFSAVTTAMVSAGGATIMSKPLAVTLPANTTRSYTITAELDSGYQMVSSVHNAIIQAFKDGSTIT
jgi:hypothetical protein